MTALEYLKSFDYLPVRNRQCARIGRGDVYHPSNSEIKRWLMNGSVIINGKKPKPWDEVIFPIKQLIFFADSKRGSCTYFDEDDNY
jgi:hypothetical protein